jgi:hypothetical protein
MIKEKTLTSIHMHTNVIDTTLYAYGSILLMSELFHRLIHVRFVYYNWPHFVKTSVLARCWTRCLDMLVRHRNVPCFAFLEDLFYA